MDKASIVQTLKEMMEKYPTAGAAKSAIADIEWRQRTSRAVPSTEETVLVTAFNTIMSDQTNLPSDESWREILRVALAAQSIIETFNRWGPTYELAQKAAAEIEKIPANQRTDLQVLFSDTVVEAESAENWERTIQAMARGYARAKAENAALVGG